MALESCSRSGLRRVNSNALHCDRPRSFGAGLHVEHNSVAELQMVEDGENAAVVEEVLLAILGGNEAKSPVGSKRFHLASQLFCSLMFDCLVAWASKRRAISSR